jgi:hypothetical protein
MPSGKGGIKVNYLNMRKEATYMFKEFKEFAVKGNVMDMAVGIIIGAAFGTIVKSLVDDVIMPPIGLLLGKVDFANLFITLKEGAATVGPYASVAAAKSAGAVCSSTRSSVLLSLPSRYFWSSSK